MTLASLLLFGICSVVLGWSSWPAVKRRLKPPPVNIFRNRVFPDPADTDWLYLLDTHGPLQIHTMKNKTVCVRVAYRYHTYMLAVLDGEIEVLVSTGAEVLRYYEAISKTVMERLRLAREEKLELDLTRLLGP